MEINFEINPEGDFGITDENGDPLSLNPALAAEAESMFGELADALEAVDDETEPTTDEDPNQD